MSGQRQRHRDFKRRSGNVLVAIDLFIAARQLADIIEIPQADIDKLNDRYQNVYGQSADARR